MCECAKVLNKARKRKEKKYFVENRKEKRKVVKRRKKKLKSFEKESLSVVC